jgi:hypothetical protein
VASIQTKTQQQVKSKGKDMTIQFQPDGVIKTEEKKTKAGEPSSSGCPQDPPG